MLWLFLFATVTYPRLSRFDGTPAYDFNRDTDVPSNAILWDDNSPILWDDSTYISQEQKQGSCLQAHTCNFSILNPSGHCKE